MQKWANKIDVLLEIKEVEDVLIFYFEFGKENKLKVDFNCYPYPRLERSITDETMKVDSMFDIGVNKLVSINQRMEIKDFVDLYFLRKKFNLWQLMNGAKDKFKFKIDPMLVASDLMKVETFDYLPKMEQPLELKDLQIYFKKQAKKLSGKSTE